MKIEYNSRGLRKKLSGNEKRTKKWSDGSTVCVQAVSKTGEGTRRLRLRTQKIMQRICKNVRTWG